MTPSTKNKLTMGILRRLRGSGMPDKRQEVPDLLSGLGDSPEATDTEMDPSGRTVKAAPAFSGLTQPRAKKKPATDEALAGEMDAIRDDEEQY